jgi:hypothetical protein
VAVVQGEDSGLTARDLLKEFAVMNYAGKYPRSTVVNCQTRTSMAHDQVPAVQPTDSICCESNAPITGLESPGVSLLATARQICGRSARLARTRRHGAAHSRTSPDWQ